jgi:hypothetical protein
MKAITLFTIACFIAATSFAQSDLMNATNPQSASLLKINKEQQTTKVAYREYTASDCSRYHKMKVAGIVLSAVGGGLFITGATMVAVDNRNTYLYGEGYYGPYHPLRNGGGAMIATGALCMGAGIPLAIIGAVKTRRYCGAAAIPRSSLDLHSGMNGTGLALNF